MTRRASTMLAWAVILGACAASIALNAHAQADPVLDFTPKLTRASETLVPDFTWTTTPPATGCTATGDDPNWQGAKPASGQVTLAAINASKTYGFSCSWPGVSSATLQWTKPTTYTNGSPLTIAGYDVYFGKSLSDLLAGAKGPPKPTGTPPVLPASVTKRAVNSPTATTTDVTGIAGTGVFFFCLTTRDAQANESTCTVDNQGQLASKTLTGAATQTRSVTLTVDPKPSAATNLVVQ